MVGALNTTQSSSYCIPSGDADLDRYYWIATGCDKVNDRLPRKILVGIFFLFAYGWGYGIVCELFEGALRVAHACILAPVVADGCLVGEDLFEVVGLFDEDVGELLLLAEQDGL